MMWAPMFAAVDPVKLESELSEIFTETPTIPHSSNGAACHRTIPPKALKVRLSLAEVVVADLCGGVLAKLLVIEDTCAAGASVCIGPSEFGAASAVGVAERVESRANIMIKGLDDDTCPPISISCTIRPLDALMAPMHM